MRIFFLFFILNISLLGAQSLHVANSYYNLGEFENAVLAYESLVKKNASNSLAVVGLAKSYRQTNQLQKAISLLESSYAKAPNRLEYLVELGVSYNQAEDKEKATEIFDTVITGLEENALLSVKIASLFKDYNLLPYTIKSYQNAMRYNEHFNYDLEIGRLYGEIGNLSGMFGGYLDYMLKYPAYINSVKRLIDEFIEVDPENEANQIFRKTLLKKNQQSPDILYNEMLSWLFVQQKQYGKAFAQERAIYRQTEDGIPQILDIATIAKKDGDYETAEEAYDFVIENATINSFVIKAQQQLLDMQVSKASAKEFSKINKEYEALFKAYDYRSEILPLQLDYAHFLGFKQNKKEEAISFLKPLSKKKFSAVDMAEIHLLIGDVLVLDEKFNQALIYYTRAQKSIKNHPLSQEASFKIAKTSYYKGDFDWANTQLNVLKESTTQLMANDAMDLSLLIYDNTKDESELSEQALKLFAKGELYTFQEQSEKALAVFNEVIDKYQSTSVEDDALYKSALLLIELQKPDQAIKNLNKLIQFFPLSLLVDDAYYELGKLQENLSNTDAAKAAYEKVIFNHADSIRFVEARKAYRRLRGDEVVN